jgi:hypothetical protein
MIHNELTASDIKKLMIRNYRRYSEGEITENKAYKENALLTSILKAIEVSETQDRLRAIEETLRSHDITEDYEED